VRNWAWSEWWVWAVAIFVVLVFTYFAYRLVLALLSRRV